MMIVIGLIIIEMVIFCYYTAIHVLDVMKTINIFIGVLAILPELLICQAAIMLLLWGL